MPRVHLQDVSLAYGANRVVAGLDLDVAHGEFLTLLGPSGCGKTSTLRMIAGLQHNTTGRIAVGDAVVSDPAAGVFVPPEKRHLGMVFQSYAIWPHMSVFENVAYPLRVQHAPRADIERRVLQALQLVSMQDYAQRPAPALSGGQQQRVAIARALVGEPSVLLLDEPLSNLDAKLRVQMGEEFRALQRRLGITTIYVTHDQEEAMTLSDRIVLMTAGRISQSGAPSELYRHPVDATVARFFGSPNMIAARVIASEGTSCRVALLGSEVDCGTARPLREGDAVEVIVRPEDIELAPEGTAAPGELALDVQVQDTTFHGSHATVALRAGDVALRAEVPARRTPALGERVTALLRRDALWCVAAGAAEDQLRGNQH